MKRYFCCSDIHSFYTEWKTAILNKGFEEDNPDHIVLICGDLFDRGSESVQCLNFAMKMAQQNRLIYVRGNHEDLALKLIADIKLMKHLGSHHISNGTVRTLADLMDVCEYDVLGRLFNWNDYDTILKNKFAKFIETTCCDYYQLGKTVFVHGWVPITCDENQITIVHDNWRDGDWDEARWENGMELFKFGICPQDIDTVVCGHWHASYGHYNITKTCAEEYGPRANFKTFTHNNAECKIVALDACTAYTKFVNCVVFDDNGNIIEN